MVEWAEFHFLDGVDLRFVTSPDGICAIDLNLSRAATGERNQKHPLLLEARRQFAAYFAGDLREFQLPLDLQGTEFQMRVWRELERIPYGEIRSYRQVAETIGADKAVRAVGAANGANPIPIVVPCHRVIGSNGRLTGYGGGLPMKRRLLQLEGCNMMLFQG